MNRWIALSVLLAALLTGCGNATMFGKNTEHEASGSVPELLTDEELRNRAPALDEYERAMSQH